MLDIDTDGDLGIVDRRKGDEGGVILSRVLDGTRLTADGVTGLDAGGGAMFDGEAHTFDDRCISLRLHLRPTLGEIPLVLRILMDMRHIIPTTISDGDSEVTGVVVKPSVPDAPTEPKVEDYLQELNF